MKNCNITSFFAGNLLFSMSFIKLIETGFDVPVFFSIASNKGNDLVDISDLKTFSFGDFRLSTKTNFVPTRNKGMGLAFGLDATFPTAKENSYVGDEFIIT